MNLNVIDLKASHASARDDLSGLQAYLAQLIGQPFRFMRVSYGDELTLHLGDLRPGRSPKRSHALYGACIIGLRASSWILKSGTGALMVSSDESDSSAFAKTIDNEELETGRFIAPDSPVFEATPFVVAPVEAIALRLRFADGSELEVIPGPPEVDEPGDEALPEIGDWELLSPAGLLTAGPRLRWSFEPAGGSSDPPDDQRAAGRKRPRSPRRSDKKRRRR
ncbi:MAG: hypothetical protein WD066_18440 [Planctomycetaceae bacterium]